MECPEITHGILNVGRRMKYGVQSYTPLRSGGTEWQPASAAGRHLILVFSVSVSMLSYVDEC